MLGGLSKKMQQQLSVTAVNCMPGEVINQLLTGAKSGGFEKALLRVLVWSCEVHPAAFLAFFQVVISHLKKVEGQICQI